MPRKTLEGRREYNTLYFQTRRQQRIEEAREFLGGCCKICGTSEGLQFDHIDPSTKLFNPSSQPLASYDRFWAEIEKCQLLCEEHHLEKSAGEKPLGSKNGNSRLRELDILYIRKLSALGYGSRKIAKEFNCGRTTIRLILSGQTWKQVV